MVLQEVENIFKTVFRDESISLDNTTSADDIDGWDSITHMSLLNEIEKHFSIDFTYKEVRNLQNIGDLINLITSKV